MVAQGPPDRTRFVWQFDQYNLWKVFMRGTERDNLKQDLALSVGRRPGPRQQAQLDTNKNSYGKAVCQIVRVWFTGLSGDTLRRQAARPKVHPRIGFGFR